MLRLVMTGAKGKVTYRLKRNKVLSLMRLWRMDEYDTGEQRLKPMGSSSLCRLYYS